MAYIRNYTRNTETGTNATAPMPVHETDDLILFLIGADNYTTTIPTVSDGTNTYTAIQNVSTGNITAGSFYFKATSSSEVAPSTTLISSRNHKVMILAIADVDTTTPVHQSGQAYGSSVSLTAPTVTTTNNNTLNIFWLFNDDGNRAPSTPPGLMALDISIPKISTEGNTSWTFQETLGSVITPTYELINADQAHVHTICLNSTGTPVVPAYADYSSPPSRIVHPLRTTAYTSSVFGGGNVDPALDLTSGMGPNSETFNYIGGGTGNAGIYGFSGSIRVPNVSSGAANEIWGTVWNLSAADDNLSGKQVCIHVGVTEASYFSSVGKVDDGGMIFGFRSDDLNVPTSNAYRVWNATAIDSSPSALYQHAVVMDVDNTALQWGADVGSETTPAFDSATVTGVFMAMNKGAGSTARTEFTECHVINACTITGGSTTLPASLITFVDSLKASRILTITNQGGSSQSQAFSFQPLQVGNGSDTVYFNQDSGSLEFPTTASAASKTLQWNAGDNGAGITFYAVSGDTISFTNSSISGTTVWDFAIHASATSAATWDFSGLNIINADVVLRDVFTAASGITFIDCPTYTANNADLTGGCTFDNTPITITAESTGTQAMDDIANCTFKNSAAAITITGNQSGTWDDPNLTVSGNTYDIEYTGTTNFTITSAVSLTHNDTGGGVLTIAAPTDDLTVNVDQTGCQIHVYTTNTQTTLDTEASASQLIYTHSLETVDITVLKDGYVPYRQTGLVLSGDITVEVQLVESREYDSSHGLTYTTDAAIYANYNIITGITQANPAVVTYSGADNFSNSDIVTLHDVVGMTEVNGNRYTVANVNTGANTFELSGINSSAFTAYTSAGIVVSGLSVPTFGPSSVGVFSLLMEQFRTNSALYNLPFNLQMDGVSALYLTNGVEGIADADIERMTAAGIGYLDVDSTQTATWVGIESVGTIPGTNTGEWTADDAVTVNDARASGIFDEIIKLHGDSDHGNFDYRANRIVMKMNINGYREQRVDVRALYGVSGNFSPAHYVVPIAPLAIGAATGDPALTTDPVITDHAATPQSWNGKNFLITITDGTTPNTGEGILRHLNYFLRSANDTTLDGNDPFSWPEMVKEVVAGTSYETLYGYTEDAQTSTLKGVRVVKNDGTTAHPDFTQFQSDDGTYYVAPITSNVSITGMPTAGNEIRLQIHNDTAKTASAWGATTAYSLGDKVLRSTGLGSESTAGLYMVCTTAGTSGGSEPTWDTTVGNTTVDSTVTWTTFAILFHDADPSSATLADTYTDGEEFATGDTYRIRFAELNTTTSFKTFETTGLVSSTGFTVVVSVIADSVYAANAVDGSSTAVTDKFTADYVNDEIDLDANQDFAVTEAFAYFSYETTTSNGMYGFWGGVTAIDSGNYRNNTAIISIYFDETSGFVKQTDSARWFRDDDTRPVIDPTTGGAGLELNWRNPVYQLETGVSGLTGSESLQLAEIDTVSTKVDKTLTTNNFIALK